MVALRIRWGVDKEVSLPEWSITDRSITAPESHQPVASLPRQHPVLTRERAATVSAEPVALLLLIPVLLPMAADGGEAAS